MNINLLRTISMTSWFILCFVFSIYFLLTWSVLPGLDDLLFCKMVSVYGFFNANVFFYNHMGGRYFSNILMSACGNNTHVINSLILCEKYISVGVCMLLPISLSVFIRALCQNNISWHNAAGFSLLFCVLYFLYTPTLQEVLYWQASAATHTLACILMLFLWSLLLQQLYHFSYLKLMLAMLISLLLPGTSESILLVTLSILILGNVLIRYDTDKFELTWMICSLVMIACLLIISQAPGNNARISTSQNPAQFLMTLHYIQRNLAHYLSHWIVNPVFFFTSILLFFSIPASSLDQMPFLKKIRTWHLCLLMGIGISLGIFIPFMSGYLISAYYVRYWNFAYFIFLLTWYLSVCLSKVILIRHDYHFTINELTKTICLAIIAFYVLLNFNFLFAANDLFTHVAPYNQAIVERFVYLQSTPDLDVGLPELNKEKIPRTTFRYDLAHDASCYFNTQYAFIFDKNSIYIAPSAQNDCIFNGQALKTALVTFSKEMAASH